MVGRGGGGLGGWGRSGGGVGARGVQCLFASLFCRSAGWPISRLND